MRLSEILAASSLVAPFVAAHGDGIRGAPKIFGIGPGVKLRDFAGPLDRRVAHPHEKPTLNKRQGGVDGQCGAAVGGASCAAGYCCSPSGFCGNTPEYCNAPDCQINFGPGCDANKIPNGASTENVARPLLGDVAYGGEGIFPCTVPGTVAITYDDGPYIYTNEVMDNFAAHNMKATFFVTGINNGKGAIDDAGTAWPAVISRMVAEGHQVASHTWSHQDLSTITSAQRIDQMVHNEMAIRNIIQKFPTYMRPPYSSCTAASGCQADMTTLGYHVTYFDLDTDDYNNLTPELIQNAKNRVDTAITPSNADTDSFLAIGHDIHPQTALNLTGYMLDLITAKGYRGVTVGECLGDPEANWYRSSSGTTVSSSSSTPSATQSASATSSGPIVTPTATSTDGTCGGSSGFTCIGFPEGQCCSQYGFCGTSVDHCGTGCQSIFGNCGSSDASSSVVVSSSTAPSSTPTNQVTSTDGSCGGTSGFNCVGYADGSCCSQYGFCGSTSDYCGTGCNSLFGTCGNVSTTSAVPSSPAVGASSTVVIPQSSSAPAASSSPVVSRNGDISSGVASPSRFLSSGASSTPIVVPAQSSSAPAVSFSSSSPIVPSAGESSSSARPSSANSSPDAASSVLASPSIAPAASAAQPSGITTSVVRPTSAGQDSASTTSRTTGNANHPASSTVPSTPSPTSNVSKNGKCGTRSDGQTCKGYKTENNKWGWGGGVELECCRWDGTCGNGALACGVGCQKKYGNCWW